jgi:hypothetical protein
MAATMSCPRKRFVLQTFCPRRKKFWLPNTAVAIVVIYMFVNKDSREESSLGQNSNHTLCESNEKTNLDDK